MNNFTVSVDMPADVLRSRFAENGVLAFPGFLGPEQLRDVSDAVRDHYDPIVRDRFGIDAVGKAGAENDCEVISWDPLGEASAPFVTLHADSRLAVVTSAILGEGYAAPRSLVMWSVGGGKGQAWHQDCPSDDALAYNVNRLFYLQDTEVEDGAIVVVPGSHRMGRIPTGGSQEPIDGEVVLTPTAGTFVLLHGHVYHRVTPNLSGRPRVSVNLRAYPSGVSPDVNRIGVYRNGAYDFKAGVAVNR